MTASKPDDLQPRDKLLARLLAQDNENLVTPIEAGACPDAEIISAYADRNLAPEEAAQYENHFATCARCQTILALVALTDEDVPVEVPELTPGQIAAQMPPRIAAEVPMLLLSEVPAQQHPQIREAFSSLASSAPSPASAPSSMPSAHRVASLSPKAVSPSPKHTRWNWLIPAMAAAAAIALWFALRPTPPVQTLSSQQLSAKNELPATQPANAENNAVLPSLKNNAQIDVQPPSPLAAPSAASTDQFSAATSQRAKTPPAPQNPATQSDTAIASAAQPESLQQLQASQGPVDQLRAEKSSAPAPATPAAQGGQNTSRETVTVTGSLPEVSQSASNSAAAPRAATNPGAVTAGLPVSAGAGGALGGASGTGAAGSLIAPRELALATTSARPSVFASPNRAVLWRIGAGGSIERSADQGKTWQAQPSGVSNNLIAGAATSNEAAWVVGTVGVVLRTTDGTHWQRMPSPFATAPQDLTAVVARDALHATITASSGRTFTTSDGGQTWMQQ